MKAIEDESAALTLDRTCHGDSFPGQFRWQQNFRVLASQFGDGRRLRSDRLIVLTSGESQVQFPWFRSAVETLARRSGISLEIVEFGKVDFFNLVEVEASIRHVVNDLVDLKSNSGGRRWNYDEILVDTTGGPKLVSIAGAAATFASEMIFSYVERGEVQLFDARASFGGR